jgi:hypothetical protein
MLFLKDIEIIIILKNIFLNYIHIYMGHLKPKALNKSKGCLLNCSQHHAYISYNWLMYEKTTVKWGLKWSIGFQIVGLE